MARLILFPVPLGNVNVDTAQADSCLPLTDEGRQMLAATRHFIVENVRTARRNLRRMGYTASFDETVFFELNEHTPEAGIAAYLNPIAEGHDVGLMSEAGVPCIADPGARIVALAQQISISTGFAHSSPKLGEVAQRAGGVCPQSSIEVVPLVGPCSLILGLMASGLNGQNFTFHGYLPFDTRQRQAVLASMEQGIFRHDQTQILIETPYRNNKLLAELATRMPAETHLCVACDLTLPTQSIRTLPARQWLKTPPDLNKHYCVFLLGLPRTT